MKNRFTILSVSILTLVGCGSDQLVGIKMEDAPSLQRAIIVIDGEQGNLELTYRANSSFPNVSTKVTVKDIGMGYEITRQDEGTRLVFNPVPGLANLYVCSDCVSLYKWKMPLTWYRE